jgi:Uma2 family endonuclease
LGPSRWEDLEPGYLPNYDNLVTEDDTPVDRIFTEKQQRLLTEPLYSCWQPGRPFVVLANVGWFYTDHQPALVPDVLLSLDIEPLPDLHSKEGRSYFNWIAGKAPDVVIEIVLDRTGQEGTLKQTRYARQGVLYYVIFDPVNLLGEGILRVQALSMRTYTPHDPGWLPEIGLGLLLWEGEFEGKRQTWLRWCDRDGQPIPTGAERADHEQQRAKEALERIARLEGQLRAAGIQPEK